MNLTADKMVDSAHQTVYLVRCTGTKDGHHCTAYVGLSSTEKAICPECGMVHAPWRAYLTTRTKDA